MLSSQVLYQAANVRSCSLYLVEHTGLLSWLASVAVNDCLSQSGSDGKGTEGELASVSLKVGLTSDIPIQLCCIRYFSKFCL